MAPVSLLCLSSEIVSDILAVYFLRVPVFLLVLCCSVVF